MQKNIASFPGVAGIIAASYTASHSITPGRISITCVQPPNSPAFGNFAISDTENTGIVRDCKLIDVTGDTQGNYTVSLEDHRWRWAFGKISGDYNRLDEHGKLVPWTIQSPKELAILCLKEMGELNYDVFDMPSGIDSTKYKNLEDWFAVGVNTVETGTNPVILWDNENPAQALANIAQRFGRRVVWDPFTGKVLIVRAGFGKQLPPGYREHRSANISVPALPKCIGVVGAPRKWQVLLRLEPVVQEWHRKFLPPDKVSFRPKDSNGKPIAKNAWLRSQPPTFSPVSATDRLTYESSVELATGSAFRCFRIADTPYLSQQQSTILPGQPGYVGGGATVTPACTVVVGYSNVKEFQNIDRRHRIVLTDEKVAQIEPQKRDARIQGLGTTFEAAAIGDFYDGYSRSQRAVVYGSIVRQLNNGNWWKNVSPDQNTPPGERINVPFSIDAANQMITFDRAIWVRSGSDTVFPTLYLECAVMIEDPDNKALYRPLRWEPLIPRPGAKPKYERDSGTEASIEEARGQSSGTPPKETEWRVFDELHDDVIVNYDWVNGAPVFKSVSYPDEVDFFKRSDNLLISLRNEHLVSGGETATYIGIRPISLDGAIMQITWTIGSGGMTTQASRNSEHEAYVAPMAVRRRNENLAPDPSTALANKVGSRDGKGLLSKALGFGTQVANALRSLKSS